MWKFFSIISILFLSCSNSIPLLDQTKTGILYEYDENTKTPTVRLAVYVNLQSSPLRIDNLQLQYLKDGLTWKIDHMQTIYDSSTKLTWIGSSNLVAPLGERIKAGRYILTYTDITGRVAKTSIQVPPYTSPDKINRENFTTEYQAVFDARGNLLYYGSPQQNTNYQSWQNNYPGASLTRKIFVHKNNYTLILDPIKLLQSNEDSNGTLRQN